MKNGSYNTGLIYTDSDNCIGCNNCIRECPELKANVCLQRDDGSFKIYTDEKECILCGTCLDTCTHGVRHFIDDADDFFNALKSGRKISVLIAPALLLNYSEDYQHILGFLKDKGVNGFYSVSYGADITSWAYLKYILEKGPQAMISQPCPAVVSHIEMHQPELLRQLMPVQSPMMCTAIHLRKYMNITDEFAFLSPCIAKKVEIGSTRGQGLIGYNVTFTRLMEKIRAEGRSLRTYTPVNDEIEYGMGGLYPVPGGLKENVSFYLGPDATVLQAEGERHLYPYLKELPSWINRVTDTPHLIDCLNCGRGCNFGTATEGRHHHTDYAQIAAGRLRKKVKTAPEYVREDGTIMTSPEERYAGLNEYYKELKLNDFLCNYNDREVKDRPSTNAIRDAYASMYKTTEADKKIDCCSCGYATCEKMAEAIAYGINHKENCVYYIKAQLRTQLEGAQRIVDAFSSISELMGQLSTENVAISKDTDDINKRVEQAVDHSGEMQQALLEVQDVFKSLTASIGEITNIARNTNILSINASIEAAHAGQFGVGFAVVANEVGDLAKKSMAAATKNRDNNENISKVLARLAESTKTLADQINEIRQATDAITENVGGIKTKSEEIVQIMDDLNA